MDESQKSAAEKWIGRIGGLIYLGLIAWLVVMSGCNAVWYSTEYGVHPDHAISLAAQ